MERYHLLTEDQRCILTRMYEYLGFNEVTSFENFVSLVFYNIRGKLSFELIVNHMLAHIVSHMKKIYIEQDRYIKYLWLREDNMLQHMTVGSNIEYDPKGILRLYIKTYYNIIAESKR